MRSRPSLKVSITPWPPIAGRPFVAEIALESRSETPYDAIVVGLRGRERRYEYSTSDGQTSTSHYARRDVVALAATLPAGVLARGERRLPVRFELPADAPPSYASPLAAIEYELDVRVDIPWWPDRHERYVVPVTLPPSPRPPHRRVTYVSREGGPHGNELYLEASLATQVVAPGEVLEGVLSIVNVAHHRVRRVELALVAVETARVKSSAGPREVHRHVYEIHDGKPDEGAALPFRVRVPAEAAPTFRSPFLDVAWSLEARAVVTLGSDATLALPVTLANVGDEPPASEGRATRTAPVGHERRARVWSAVGARRGLQPHEQERLRGALDDVAIEIRPEAHDEGVWATARLTWPTLGLDVRVAERKWIDRLIGEDLRLDRDFSARFSTAARERAQAAALLDEAVRGALIGFDHAALDDGGAVLAAPDATFDEEALDAFVARVQRLAAAIVHARGAIPPAAEMAAHAEAYRAFAREHGGRFEPGRVFVHGATIDGEQVDVGTLFAEGRAAHTLARVHLAKNERDEARLSEAIARAGVTPDLDDEGLLLRRAPPLADPRALEGDLRALTEIARGARGGRGGAYR